MVKMKDVAKTIVNFSVGLASILITIVAISTIGFFLNDIFFADIDEQNSENCLNPFETPYCFGVSTLAFMFVAILLITLLSILWMVSTLGSEIIKEIGGAT